jgi:lipoprotein signal peptidase
VWPVFNAADSAVVLGAIALVLLSARRDARDA